MSKIVSIFGSSGVLPGSDEYDEAYRVGQLLAESGFSVMTGGYMGTMEAISRGANEAGGHVIGVTADEIEAFRPIGPNPWIIEEIRYQTALDRLVHLVTRNVGMITLPGGIGTLAEIAAAWNMLQTNSIPSNPLVAMGPYWEPALTPFLASHHVPETYRSLIYFASGPADAVNHIKMLRSADPSSAIVPVSDDLVFLKLGGSLITDKTKAESVREDTLARLAAEIKAVLDADPTMKLLLGHGSGSFGHTHAAEHGTRDGVSGEAAWAGFTAVSDSALRLNRLVVGALQAAGVSAISLSPSASALVTDGKIEHMATGPIKAALDAGLVPVIHGDVAFDRVRGGTIISTEEIMTYLAGPLKPTRLLLAGEVDGVYDLQKMVISQITADNFDAIRPALGGSRGTDVTGGMVSKVEGMLALSKEMGGLPITIFSGLNAGNLSRLMIDQEMLGTQIC